MFASKFSPRHYNNDIFVQLKRGESLGKLISLAVQGQPAWTLLQGTKTEDKLNAADVRGDNCDARVSASGKDDFRALAFDCTAPTDIRMYDRNAHCRYSQDIYGEKTSMHILQNVAAETLPSVCAP